MKQFMIPTNTDYMLQCLETGELSDQTLILTDESKKEVVLYVSRLILASKSKYFQHLFSPKPKDQTKEIKIYVNDVEITRNIIYMMYGKEQLISRLVSARYDDIAKYLLELSKYDNEFNFLLMDVNLSALMTERANCPRRNTIKFIRFLFERSRNISEMEGKNNFDEPISSDEECDIIRRIKKNHVSHDPDVSNSSDEGEVVDEEEVVDGDEDNYMESSDLDNTKLDFSDQIAKTPIRELPIESKSVTINKITSEEASELLLCDLLKKYIQMTANYHLEKDTLSYQGELLKSSLDVCCTVADIFQDAETLIVITRNGDVHLVDYNLKNPSKFLVGKISNFFERVLSKHKCSDRQADTRFKARKGEYIFTINNPNVNDSKTYPSVNAIIEPMDFKNNNPVIIIKKRGYTQDEESKTIIFDLIRNETIYSSIGSINYDLEFDGTVLTNNYSYAYKNSYICRTSKMRKTNFYLPNVIQMFPVKNFIHRRINDIIQIKKLIEM